MVNFQRISACLEGSIWDQFGFFQSLYDPFKGAVMKLMGKTIEEKESIDPDRDNCEGEFF